MFYPMSVCDVAFVPRFVRLCVIVVLRAFRLEDMKGKTFIMGYTTTRTSDWFKFNDSILVYSVDGQTYDCIVLAVDTYGLTVRDEHKSIIMFPWTSVERMTSNEVR